VIEASVARNSILNQRGRFKPSPRKQNSLFGKPRTKLHGPSFSLDFKQDDALGKDTLMIRPSTENVTSQAITPSEKCALCSLVRSSWCGESDFLIMF
jgi:hypothetical protein